MKGSSVLSIVSLLLCCALSKPLPAQFARITDVPFTANVSVLLNGQAGVTEKIARASNGSTYDATIAKDGHVVHVMIVDVPNHRLIDLMPSPPSYTYTLHTLDPRTCTIEEYRTTLQRAQDSYRERPDRDKASGSHQHEIPLGVRQEDGMTLFGNRDEITLASGEKRTVEAWESDLGVAATRVDTSAATQLVRKLTNVHLVEPDPKLFEIPSDYIPHPDPLLDGKKVFVDNQTGIPDVAEAAISQFNAFGPSKHPWVVVRSMEDADIVAVFANVTRTDDLDPPFEMTIHAPGSNEILFVSHPRRNPEAPLRDYLAYERSLAAICVGNLWSRILNTHIGLIAMLPVAPKPLDQITR